MKLRALLWPGLAALAAAQAEHYCKDGVYIITARATNQMPGFAGLQVIKDYISFYVPGSGELALPYPAAKNHGWYLGSVIEGVKMLTHLITQYADACPGHGIVLMGNSQGAHVVADTLAGYEYDKYPQFGTSTGLDQKYVDSIAAAVLLGDPSNTAGQPILVGNSTNSGYHPRKDPGSWARKGLVDRVRSYCDAGDIFCDGGSDVVIHVSYTGHYETEIVQWVVERSQAYMMSHKPGYSDPNSIPVDAPDSETLSAQTPSTPMIGPSVLTSMLLIGGLLVLIFYSFRSYLRPTMRRLQAGYFT